MIYGLAMQGNLAIEYMVFGCNADADFLRMTARPADCPFHEPYRSSKQRPVTGHLRPNA